MKILILGAAGMLGNELAKTLSRHDLIMGDLPDWDITKADDLYGKIKSCLPELIINCAAFTNVESAEDNIKQAFMVNGEGPLNLSKIADSLKIVLTHLSTDYVFDGEKPGGYGYNEDDITRPLNAYGKSKEQGEKNIIGNCQRFYIIRTSWLFGRQSQISPDGKKCFVDAMLELGAKEQSIKVVNDVFSKPTYVKDLSLNIKNIIEKKLDYGIYHVINEGTTNWHSYAAEIFKQKKIGIQLIPIPAAEFFTKAVRPKNSSLNNNKLPKLRMWQDALGDYLTREM